MGNGGGNYLPTAGRPDSARRERCRLCLTQTEAVAKIYTHEHMINAERNNKSKRDWERRKGTLTEAPGPPRGRRFTQRRIAKGARLDVLSGFGMNSSREWLSLHFSSLIRTSFIWPCKVIRLLLHPGTLKINRFCLTSPCSPQGTKAAFV